MVTAGTGGVDCTIRANGTGSTVCSSVTGIATERGDGVTIIVSGGITCVGKGAGLTTIGAGGAVTIGGAGGDTICSEGIEITGVSGTVTIEDTGDYCSTVGTGRTGTESGAEVTVKAICSGGLDTIGSSEAV